VPDDALRTLERRLGQGDLDALTPLAQALRRAGRAPRRPHDGVPVRGEVLGAVLGAALARTGQREIDLVRAAGVPPRQEERWVRALRLLTAGDARAWVWVARWAPLLAVDAEELLLVARAAPPAAP
jgi:hypothetical protein